MGLTVRDGSLKTRLMLNVPWLCGGGLVAAMLAVLLSGCASHVAQISDAGLLGAELRQTILRTRGGARFDVGARLLRGW